MSGLRTTRGVSLPRMRSLANGNLEDILNFKQIDKYQELGLLSVEGDRLLTSREGRNVLDSLLPEIYK